MTSLVPELRGGASGRSITVKRVDRGEELRRGDYGGGHDFEKNHDGQEEARRGWRARSIPENSVGSALRSSGRMVKREEEDERLIQRPLVLISKC